MCRCPDACGRDFKRNIGHRYARQERQGGFVAVVVKVVHGACDRDAERDDSRALSRRRLGRRRLGRRWCGRWRRRRRRVWLEVGVEAAGPIGGVEAAIGCVDEGARREELATLCPRVIDVPAGGSKAQKLDERTVTGGRVAPPQTTGAVPTVQPTRWHHWAQPAHKEGSGGRLTCGCHPMHAMGFPQPLTAFVHDSMHCPQLHAPLLHTA